jgi:hypothetical protein
VAGRYDKYEPKSGGFRAPLAAALNTLETVRGVGLDANGRVLWSAAGNTGFAGVLAISKAKAAGDIVDVMTDGEIVDVDGLVAGTTYYLAADGTLTDVPGTRRVGHTVEADRLVVRFQEV